MSTWQLPLSCNLCSLIDATSKEKRNGATEAQRDAYTSVSMRELQRVGKLCGRGWKRKKSLLVTQTGQHWELRACSPHTRAELLSDDR